MADTTNAIIDVRADFDPAYQKLKNYEKQAQRAATRAVVDAQRAMLTAAGREVRKKKAIKLAFLRQKVFYTPPPADLRCVLRIKNIPMPVAAYPYRQNKAGISASINAGNRSVIRHAFEATMQSTHTGVFLRQGYAVVPTKGRYKGKMTRSGKPYVRQPIIELYSSKAIDVFYDDGVKEEVLARGRAAFRVGFLRNLGGPSGRAPPVDED